MFEGFKKKVDPDAKRRYALSAGVSVFLYGFVAAAALVAAGRARPPEPEEPKVEVIFRPPPPPAEAAPPPAPKPKPAPPPPVPEGMKTKVVKALPPPSELVAPDKLPEGELAEGHAEDDAVPVLEDQGPGASGGLEGGTAPPEAPAPAPEAPKVAAPINLPEDAEPPEEDERNDHDGDRYYPAEAKAKGLEGMVILKIVITAEGSVGKIQVLRGEAPFIGAAVSMVKGWRYRPARVEGKAVAVFKILKIPFKLRS